MEEKNPQKRKKILIIIASILSIIALVSIIVALIVVNGLKIQNSTLVFNEEGEAVFADNEILKLQEAEERQSLHFQKRF